MDKVSEAKIFLKSFGMPGKQQSDIAAYTLLTLAHMKPSDHWNDATNDWIRIHDVLQFTGENYGKIWLFWHRCGSVTPTFPYAA